MVVPWHSSYKLLKNKEPTSGLDPLSSLGVIIQALQRFAEGCECRIYRPVYFLRLALRCTVLRSRWCQSGIHITLLSAFDRGLPQAGSTTFLARQTTTAAANPPQPLASPLGASPASCKGSGETPGNRTWPSRVSVLEHRDCPDRPQTSDRPSFGD
jgi:hypothetical protein